MVLLIGKREVKEGLLKLNRNRCRKIEYITIPYVRTLHMVGLSLLPLIYLKKMQNTVVDTYIRGWGVGDGK